MYINSIAKTTEPLDERDGYLLKIPAIAALNSLTLKKPVTFFVGENGSGKSTLLEAIAVNFGFNPEGGSRELTFTQRKHIRGCTRCCVLARACRARRMVFFCVPRAFTIWRPRWTGSRMTRSTRF